MSVQLNDRAQSAKVVIQQVTVSQHISVRSSSNMCVEKGEKVRFCLNSPSLCKMSNFADFSVIRSGRYLISLTFSANFFSVAEEKILKSLAGVKNSEQFRLVGAKNCENLRENQFHIKIAEFRFKISLLETERVSNSWLKKFLQKVFS